MNKDDSLKCIRYLSSAIEMLEGTWKRPHTELETAIIHTLLEVHEIVRKSLAAEQPQSDYQAMEAALQVLAGNVNSLRTELLVIKAEIMKDKGQEL